jgi:hypothetical protein
MENVVTCGVRSGQVRAMPGNLTALDLELDRRATVGAPPLLFSLTFVSIGRRPRRARAHPRVGEGNHDHHRQRFELYPFAGSVGRQSGDNAPLIARLDISS